MICLGKKDEEKRRIVAEYSSRHDIERIHMLSPEKLRFPYQCDFVEFDEIITYKQFYRLLQEIGDKSLVVVNECLRKKDRHDLTYNCIRNYLNQTPHVLVFQWLPIISSREDFLVLVDFDTESRWKRDKSERIIGEAKTEITERAPRFERVPVPTSPGLKKRYEAKKRELIDNIGGKDPHTIPRNLYLLGGREKARAVSGDRWMVGRNRRLGVDRLRTFADREFAEPPYTILEVCHDFLPLRDFLALSGQEEVPMMVADLKVDEWYFTRCEAWTKEIEHVYSAIRQHQKRP